MYFLHKSDFPLFKAVLIPNNYYYMILVIMSHKNIKLDVRTCRLAVFYNTCSSYSYRDLFLNILMSDFPTPGKTRKSGKSKNDLAILINYPY